MNFWEREKLSPNPASVDDMVIALAKHRHFSPLAGTCFATARALNLNKEQTFVLLAYHALRMYEEACDREMDRTMTDTKLSFRR